MTPSKGGQRLANGHRGEDASLQHRRTGIPTTDRAARCTQAERPPGQRRLREISNTTRQSAMILGCAALAGAYRKTEYFWLRGVLHAGRCRSQRSDRLLAGRGGGGGGGGWGGGGGGGGGGTKPT